MSKSISALGRIIAGFLAVLMIVPLGECAVTLPAAPAPQIAGLPSESAPTSAGANGSAQNQQQPSQPSSDSQQNTNQQPVGTAVAPVVKPGGSPASRPAGAAIAPAKQRRRHTFAIRTALIVGAAIAIGTVAAASLGSPARAH